MENPMRCQRTNDRRPTGLMAWLVTGLLVACAWPVPDAIADEYDRAKRMHDRLVGVPPTDAVLEVMAQRIRDDNVTGAADYAMQNRAFYSSTLKTFVTPWTNAEQTTFAPLNDYTATVIGIIRDGRSFKEVLTGDVVYVGANQTPGYSRDDNLHYEALEQSGADLGNRNVLEPELQSDLTNLLPSEAAGVITTRAAGKAFFSAGTNRRMWRFLAINYLCSDLEYLKDNTLAFDRIRQDVTRSPGGDSEIFLNDCAGCHTGMDPMSGAFAYFEWVPEEDDDTRGRVEYTRGVVQEKYQINANTFPFGFATEDDRWDNPWRVGANSVLGWRTPESGGFGPKSMGQQLADSEAFSRCQVQKVFEQVCFRPPSDLPDRRKVEEIREDFEANGYQLLDVFADTAAYCTEGM
jgi:hypothetical protein